MTLDEANQHIKECAGQMNAAYRKAVFDEWAIVAFRQRKGTMLSYHGPRREDFERNFISDLKDLNIEMLTNTHGIGDFEFTRHGVGTKVEACMVVGMGIYLICNHTTRSMEDITKDPLWLNAQIPFVELSDRIRASPIKG